MQFVLYSWILRKYSYLGGGYTGGIFPVIHRYTQQRYQDSAYHTRDGRNESHQISGFLSGIYKKK